MSKKMQIYKPPLKCCLSSKHADTGRFTKGLHNHAQSRDRLHHATGTRFRADPSTTKAVLVRMKELGVE
jgi:hypothetical protein